MHNSHILLRRPASISIPGLALIFAMVMGFPTLSSAQGSNPVENLKRAIIFGQKPEMSKAVAEIQTFRQMAEGLLLSSWPSEDAATTKEQKQLFQEAKEAREELLNRFSKEAREGARSSDEAYRIAVASMLGEFAIETRSGGTSSASQNRMIFDSFSDLATLLVGMAKNDPQVAVRAAAVRALSKLRTDPKLTEATLTELLGPDQPPPLRREAAQALADLLVLSSAPGRRSDESARTELPLDDRAHFGAVIFVVAPKGLQSWQDVEVRRLSALAMERVASAVNDILELESSTGQEGPRRRLVPILNVAPQAVRALAEVVRTDTSSTVRLAASRALEQIGTVRQRWMRESTDNKVELGPGAPPRRESSVEQLLPISYGDEKTRTGTDLTGHLDLAVQALSRRLQDPLLANRLAAIEALEMILSPLASIPDVPARKKAEIDKMFSPATQIAAIHALLDAMQDTNPRSRYVRWVAARTLGKVGPIESDQVQRVVVAALAQRVSDEDLGIRRAAATALANFGNVAGDARPALAWAVVRGGDTEVRLAAIRAVAAIGEATDPVIDALADSLTASKMDIRKEAARALGAVDTSRARKEQSAAFQKATDALLRVMATDQDSEFRALASTAVLQMRSPARPRKGL